VLPPTILQTKQWVTQHEMQQERPTVAADEALEHTGRCRCRWLVGGECRR